MISRDQPKHSIRSLKTSTQHSNRTDTTQILPDVIVPDLTVLFCGSAASTKSALLGAYYAGPGNRFWPILHEIKLTPRTLRPSEFMCLPDYGLGLTDLAKSVSGADSSLPGDAYDPDLLTKKVIKFRPSILAFNGKTPARAFLKHPIIYGLQSELTGDSNIFVLPSTSAVARRYWDSGPWYALSYLVADHAELTKS